jgi:hypothetical protein
MSLRFRGVLLGCCVALTSCAHGPCKTLGNLFGCNCVKKPEFSNHPDPNITLPVFDSTLRVDADVDGSTLQAIRIAADDYLTPGAEDRPCERRQSSYGYQALRQGDIIFVRIDFKPENCGGAIDMLDGGATYAISTEGRILRRALDGREPL